MPTCGVAVQAFQSGCPRTRQPPLRLVASSRPTKATASSLQPPKPLPGAARAHASMPPRAILVVARRAVASCLQPPVPLLAPPAPKALSQPTGPAPCCRSASRPRPSTAASAPRSAPAWRTSRPRPYPGGLGASAGAPWSPAPRLPRAPRSRCARRACHEQACRAVAPALSAWRRSQMHASMPPRAILVVARRAEASCLQPPVPLPGASRAHCLAPSALHWWPRRLLTPAA